MGCIWTTKAAKKMRNIIIKDIKETYIGGERVILVVKCSASHKISYPFGQKNPIRGRIVNITANNKST
jgi:hypothetical protein